MPHKVSAEGVRHLVLALLQNDYPGIDLVAELLHVSRRTLQRQLHKEQLTYVELVARCRLEEARRLLTHSNDRVQDIAALLGYRDASSFSRAFIQWTGLSPRTYRSRQNRCRDERLV